MREGLWFFHKESVPQIKRGALQLEPSALNEACEHWGAGFIQLLLFEGAVGYCHVVILSEIFAQHFGLMSQVVHNFGPDGA